MTNARFSRGKIVEGDQLTGFPRPSPETIGIIVDVMVHVMRPYYLVLTSNELMWTTPIKIHCATMESKTVLTSHLIRQEKDILDRLLNQRMRTYMNRYECDWVEP